ncbi:hypothetical protein Ctob_001736 [Chrysochromulina tobinii]|uniref:Uncharacterized protein n=1 Tax=Chrysochromulina tobinii TaxID=1460289 RepID=A0A0M0J8Y7_9EUKA|nr:hypothetical protein Ctob_001736 [Chrysochromulina tobinii]|eukprot:KOO23041.1 hypothetical protein Ctob_001736 [Chrysochromulina sp. CCMP291]
MFSTLLKCRSVKRKYGMITRACLRAVAPHPPSSFDETVTSHASASGTLQSAARRDRGQTPPRDRPSQVPPPRGPCMSGHERRAWSALQCRGHNCRRCQLPLDDLRSRLARGLCKGIRVARGHSACGARRGQAEGAPEQPRRLVARVFLCEAESARTVLAFRRDVGTLLEQQLHELRLSVLAGRHERTPPVARFGLVDVGPMLEEQSRALEVPILAREHQRCPTVIMPGGPNGRAPLEQQPRALKGAYLTCRH